MYARRRFAVGVGAGFIGHLVLAFLLGLLLAGGFSLQVRLLSTLISCVIATPGLISLGLAAMLREDSRPFGGGILVGAVVSTFLILIGWMLT